MLGHTAGPKFPLKITNGDGERGETLVEDSPRKKGKNKIKIKNREKILKKRVMKKLSYATLTHARRH